MVAASSTKTEGKAPFVETSLTMGAVDCRIASTRDEREAAFHLVYNAYERAGLIEPNALELRVTTFHLLPTTNLFIAKCGDEVIGTITLIGDGTLGLPLESVYGEEVNELRNQGVSLGEVSCLAHRRMSPRQMMPLFIALTRLLTQHARFFGMDRLLIAAHPRHAQFYVRFLGFEQFGSERSYPSVRNNPAVACCLDLARLDRNRPAYDQYFGETISPEKLFPVGMTESETAFFSRAAESTSICLPGVMC